VSGTVDDGRWTVPAEVLDQRRDWLLSVVTEALEDIAFVQAIKAGEDTEEVPRDEIFRLLGVKA